ncbi:hypothetical protein LPTSP4_08740 [Leptospira ryugenii]|uniref:Uncharacterized protein n=1 Tax=Leptospira ryugenii TaxID=1917863 RepID=A0A2P2DXJ9_9LEPT|nr:hypothetical protein [Leptospira ryugenii]GBF49363.1 hypothetical protein LPTSP4_08740 [Leptospira ryugenii]
MEFALFLFFFVFFSLVTSVCAYYAELLFFDRKQKYEREEITDVWLPSIQKLLDVLEKGTSLPIGLPFFLGFGLLAWLWTLLGGIVGEPHYAHSPGNYMFHSPIFWMAYFISLPYLKEGFSGNPIVDSIVANARPSLSGFGIGFVSANFSAWGLYHEFYFVFPLFHLLFMLYPFVYLWNGREWFGLYVGPRALPSSSYYSDDIYQEENSQPDDIDWDSDEGLGAEAPSLDDWEEQK